MNVRMRDIVDRKKVESIHVQIRNSDIPTYLYWMIFDFMWFSTFQFYFPISNISYQKRVENLFRRKSHYLLWGIIPSRKYRIQKKSTSYSDWNQLIYIQLSPFNTTLTVSPFAANNHVIRLDIFFLKIFTNKSLTQSIWSSTIDPWYFILLEQRI